METFSALLDLCARNLPVTGEFHSQRPVTRSFDVFSDLHLNKQFSKQSWGWWFETPSHAFWRHRNVDGNLGKPNASCGNTHCSGVDFMAFYELLVDRLILWIHAYRHLESDDFPMIKLRLHQSIEGSMRSQTLLEIGWIIPIYLILQANIIISFG